jgi:hypothetical protein
MSPTTISGRKSGLLTLVIPLMWRMVTPEGLQIRSDAAAWAQVLSGAGKRFDPETGTAETHPQGILPEYEQGSVAA